MKRWIAALALPLLLLAAVCFAEERDPVIHTGETRSTASAWGERAYCVNTACDTLAAENEVASARMLTAFYAPSGRMLACKTGSLRGDNAIAPPEDFATGKVFLLGNGLTPLTTAEIRVQEGTVHPDVTYRWQFHMLLENTGTSRLTLQSLEIVKRLGGENGILVGEHLFEGTELVGIGLATEGEPLQLVPGDSYRWGDGHPLVDAFDFMGYTFTFTDSNGEETKIEYNYPLSHDPDGADSTLVNPLVQVGDWRFAMRLENTGSAALTLESLRIAKRLGGESGSLVGESLFEGSRLAEIGLANGNAPLVLAPGDAYVWGDGHPTVDFFDHMSYVFTFTDAAGNRTVLVYLHDLAMDEAAPEYPSYGEDEGRDLATLRYDASFSVKVHDGVWWVPARTLGSSDYTNAGIQALLTDEPEEKQQKIDTLYEALQLYQIGAFAAADDNIRIRENGIDWEHHKPGYHAVRTNKGCCATDSNWLRYILDGDYDEVGYMATSQRDGSGHIFNYIKEDGWYYFIDLTHYRTDWVATAVESGALNDYYGSDFVLGNIHKVQDVQDFVDYVQDAFGDPPGLMFFYTAENCLALDGVRSGDSITITYETVDGVNVAVVFDDPNDKLGYAFVESPTMYPNWAAQKGFDFSVIQ